MNFNLNHQTSYSYNKFTCRPGYIVVSKTLDDVSSPINVRKLKPTQRCEAEAGAEARAEQKGAECSSQPKDFVLAHSKPPNATIKTARQPSAAKQTRAGVLRPPSASALSKRAQRKWGVIKRKQYENSKALTYESNKNYEVEKIPVRNHFFKARPLLCWHNDLAYYNLRLYFLNTLRALHVCWSAVRNNKKIGFVGVSGDLLNQASCACLTSWFKTQSLTRDSLPRIRADYSRVGKNADEANLHLTQEKKPKSLKTKRKNSMFLRNRRQNHFIFYNYGLWINMFQRTMQCYKTAFMPSVSPAQPSANALSKGVPNDISKRTKAYVLMAKLMKAYQESDYVFFKASNVARLSNPNQAVKTASSHLLMLKSQGLQRRSQSSWSQLTYRFGQVGLKAPVQDFDLNFAPARSHFETNTNIKSTLKNYDTFYNLRVRPRARHTHQKKVSYAVNAHAQVIHFLFACRVTSDSKASKSNQALNKSAYETKKKYRGCYVLNYRNQKRIQNGQFLFRNLRHGSKPTFRRRLSYAPRYTKMLQRVEFYDITQFAINANLKQADVLFFLHPDKAYGMVRNAKNLRIATIGIVSGLKSKVKSHLKHNYMTDDVNYPIVGNPDNNFFILHMLRTFMQVIRKANANRSNIV